MCTKELECSHEANTSALSIVIILREPEKRACSGLLPKV